MILQVDTFRGSISGQEDTHRRNGWISLEGCLNSFALVGGHAAVERHQSLAAGQPVRGEDRLEPALGVAILGENDHPLLCPLAIRREQVRLEPAEQRLRLAVRSSARGVCPGA